MVGLLKAKGVINYCNNCIGAITLLVKARNEVVINSDFSNFLAKYKKNKVRR